MQSDTEARNHAILLLKPGLTEADTRISEALALLQAWGLRVTAGSPASPSGIEDLLRQHAGRVDRVIVAGGDGTLHTLAPALIEAGLPVGILPCGTANDLARALGIPDDLTGACALMVRERPRRIDVGEVNGVHFFNVAHIGVAAEAARQTGKAAKKYLGFIAYFIGAWRAFRAQRGFRAWIDCDGASRRFRAMQVSVGNGPFYGGGNCVSDEAAIDDGLLDLVALPRLSGGRMVALARALRIGKIHNARGMLALRGAAIEVRTRKPRTVTADGERATQTPARFRVLPGALSVYAAEP